MTASSELPAMLTAILQAARDRFPGHDWPSVEDHIRKAWNAFAHDAPWEEVSEPARRAWEGSQRP